jgi:hypothetical protein
LKKGFISLEYILIFAALLTIFSIFLITINNLYSNNLEVIDTKNLQSIKTNIQDIISFQELQTTSLNKIIISPKDCWNINKINNQKIIIKNNIKEYKIFTNNSFIVNNIDICSKQQLVIETNNNKIHLYLEQV